MRLQHIAGVLVAIFLASCTAPAGRADVVINEVHSDPDIKTEHVEFVELYNSGTGLVDLTSWYFSDGIDYIFPNNTLLVAGGYLVVSQDPAAITNKFGVQSYGPFSGKLSNGGERIALKNNAGGLVDEVDYQLGFPWPTVGDAPGNSMQLLNPALDNDLGGSWRSAGPTPMAASAVLESLDAIPPHIRQVNHEPDEPTSSNNVVITAKITDTNGINSVTLQYQLVDPGSYIRVSDAEFPTNWTDVAMNDSGTGGDVLAGDDIYTVTMTNTLQTHRRLVRYRITVEDTLFNSQLVPYADDQQSNFAYFVYDGIPDWTGADNPGTTPTTNFPGNTMEPLATYHLIANSDDVINSQYVGAYDGVRFNGTLVYDGTVYDHIIFYNRGEYSTYQCGKNKWRIRFNRGHALAARNDYGKKYEVGRDAINLNACAAPWMPVHRGIAGMDEVISFKLYELAGVFSPDIHWIQFRVIDGAEETPAGDQYAGDLWGLYNVVEHPNGDFISEHDLPSGNLYKIEGNKADKKHQGATQTIDDSDWTSFNAGCGSLNTVEWWRNNLHLESYYSFRAINRLVGNVDIREGWNHFMYHNTNDLWHVIPWDLDMTFIPETHWSGTIVQKTCLGHAEIAIEFRNRARELHDLLCTDTNIYGGQASQLVENYARFVHPTNKVLTSTVLDRYMWNHHPRTTSAHKGQFYVTPKNQSNRGGTWTRYLVPANHLGSQKFIRDYLTDTDSDGWALGDGDQYGYGYEYLASEGADAEIPDTPTISYVGPGEYPLNDLTFQSSTYSGTHPFAAMCWRIGEIYNPGTTNYSAGEKWKYEINAQWESGVISNFNNQITAFAGDLRVGSTYRARVRMKDDTGRWSHWSDPVEFTAGHPENTSALSSYFCVTEVMYDPPDGGEYEFVELHNCSDSITLDLAAVKFTQGIDYTFGEGSSIPPGGYVLVVQADPTNDFAAFRAYYDLTNTVPITGPYDGNLANGGEELRLKAAAGGSAVSSFTYGDSRTWPPAADGSGHSLVALVLTDQASGVLDWPGNWRASAYMNGSPGREDPQPPTGVVINEIAAHTDYTNAAKPEYDSNDWMELYNASSSTVSLADWYLSDDGDDLRKWAIPATNSIPAGEWITFDEVTGFHSPITNGFGLDKAGEQVFLSYLPGTTNDRVVDAVRFKGQERETTLGRYPDGDAYWYSLEPTTNVANATPPKHAIISELMVHPPATASNPEDNAQDEYVKLYNPTDGQVDFWTEAGPWRIGGGIDFSFPENVSLAARGSLLLVPFDPADTNHLDVFLDAYGLTNIQGVILGPYTGRLSNSGERIAIERPQLPDFPSVDVSWIIVDEAIYSTHWPWPTAVQTNGLSLHRTVSGGAGNNPAYWSASAASPSLPPGKIVLTEPMPGGTVWIPELTLLKVSVDEDQVVGFVDSVRFLLDGVVTAIDTDSPYESALDHVDISTTGVYRVRAEIVDDSGTNSSVEIVINGALADRIDIASPAADTVLLAPCSLDFSIDVDANHVAGAVDHVTLLAGTNVLYVDMEEPYVYTLDEVDLPPGTTYVLSAVMEDDFAVSTSETVNVTLYASSFAAWEYRMQVSVSGYASSQGVEDFPVLVKLHEGLEGFRYDDVGDPASGGASLRVADVTGTNILYHEIGNWDTGGTSCVWVLMPELPEDGTSISIYWGNDSATDPPAYTTNGSVWANSFDLVMHMADDAGSTTVYDSTSNDVQTTFRSSYTWEEPGQVGRALGLPSVSSIIQVADPYVPLAGSWTISTWFKGLYPTIEGRTLARTFSGDRAAIVKKGTDDLGVQIGLDFTDSGYDMPAGDTEWHHLAVVGEGGGTGFYVDGRLVGSAGNQVGGSIAYIANTFSIFGGECFAEYIDEFRIESVARSSNWIWTCWLNQSDNPGFMVQAPAENQQLESEPDGDGDGMRDSWENDHFGTVYAPGGEWYSDPDGDRMINSNEYVAGTDPTNSNSVFSVDVSLSNAAVRVEFFGIEASAYGEGYQRYYSLENATNLSGGWSGVNDYTNLQGQNRTIIYTNEPGATVPVYFRGQVWLVE